MTVEALAYWGLLRQTKKNEGIEYKPDRPIPSGMEESCAGNQGQQLTVGLEKTTIKAKEKNKHKKREGGGRRKQEEECGDKIRTETPKFFDSGCKI